MDAFDADEFDHYTTALLCGGPSRVVQIAVFTLYEERRVRIFRGTHRVEVVRREESGDPLLDAVLGEIPRIGRPLGQVIAAVAGSPEVAAIGEAMREAGLLRGRRLRPTRLGRTLRRTLAERPGASQVERLAVLGPAGIEDAKLREILESGDPKPVTLPRARSRGRWNLEASNLSDDQYGGGAY
ncbi:TIGR04222 domain-containing membrane protein [Spirillospora sp. CA-128828]|uniref:TIGR04222 domain-containing membrane protein n=1 Tax=Spirillospora sp. CA-128828 TaxID=3240033 RepID=UPI003D8C82C6